MISNASCFARFTVRSQPFSWDNASRKDDRVGFIGECRCFEQRSSYTRSGLNRETLEAIRWTSCRRHVARLHFHSATHAARARTRRGTAPRDFSTSSESEIGKENWTKLCSVVDTNRTWRIKTTYFYSVYNVREVFKVFDLYLSSYVCYIFARKSRIFARFVIILSWAFRPTGEWISSVFIAVIENSYNLSTIVIIIDGWNIMGKFAIAQCEK